MVRILGRIAFRSAINCFDRTMICWDRRGDEVVGYFDEFEVQVLRDYGASLLRLLDHRAGSYHVWSESESIPSAATDDLRILAILRSELGSSEPEWALACQEVRCLAEVSAVVREQLASLPRAGGLVCLGSDQVASWSKVLRWYLAVIDAVTDDTGVAVGKPVEPTVTWLSGVAAGLRDQMSLHQETRLFR